MTKINLKIKGYITQKKEDRPKNKDNDGPDFLLTNQEFHPFLYAQHKLQPHRMFDTFDQAVDEFFSTLEGQKIDVKVCLNFKYFLNNSYYLNPIFLLFIRLFILNVKL